MEKKKTKKPKNKYVTVGYVSVCTPPVMRYNLRPHRTWCHPWANVIYTPQLILSKQRVAPMMKSLYVIRILNSVIKIIIIIVDSVRLKTGGANKKKMVKTNVHNIKKNGYLSFRFRVYGEWCIGWVMFIIIIFFFFRKFCSIRNLTPTGNTKREYFGRGGGCILDPFLVRWRGNCSIFINNGRQKLREQ